MKKNKMMRLASVLLVLVMLTTCVISGTFAKYVDQASDADSARVAKWGIDISVSAQNAFADQYENAATAVTVLTSEPGKNVLAPGTNGTLAIASIEGTPEVDYHVAIAVDLQLNGWEIDSVEYCPIKFMVGTTEFYMANYTKIADLEEALEKAVITALVNAEAYKAAPTVEQHLGDKEGLVAQPDGFIGVAQYAPNKSCTKDVTITWEWAYEAASGDTYQTDAKDTKLGNLFEDGTPAEAPTISFNLAISATQQD